MPRPPRGALRPDRCVQHPTGTSAHQHAREHTHEARRGTHAQARSPHNVQRATQNARTTHNAQCAHTPARTPRHNAQHTHTSTHDAHMDDRLRIPPTRNLNFTAAGPAHQKTCPRRHMATHGQRLPLGSGTGAHIVSVAALLQPELAHKVASHRISRARTRSRYLFTFFCLRVFPGPYPGGAWAAGCDVHSLGSTWVARCAQRGSTHGLTFSCGGINWGHVSHLRWQAE